MSDRRKSYFASRSRLSILFCDTKENPVTIALASSSKHNGFLSSVEIFFVIS